MGYTVPTSFRNTRPSQHSRSICLQVQMHQAMHHRTHQAMRHPTCQAMVSATIEHLFRHFECLTDPSTLQRVGPVRGPNQLEGRSSWLLSVGQQCLSVCLSLPFSPPPCRQARTFSSSLALAMRMCLFASPPCACDPESLGRCLCVSSPQ